MSYASHEIAYNIRKKTQITDSEETTKMGGDTERQIWHGTIDF